MAEVRAAAPEHAGLVGDEGHRLGFQRVHDEVHVVVRDRKAVRQVFDLVQVGRDQRDLVTFLELELAQAERGACEVIFTVTFLPLWNTPDSLRVLDGQRESSAL